MRREWIEMADRGAGNTTVESPSMRREWIEMEKQERQQKKQQSLPPCGGSGLKYHRTDICWGYIQVSLHAEGVD